MSIVSKENIQAVTSHYLALGATLYTPATRRDLAQILRLEKLSSLRSVVACTEDAIHLHELEVALSNLEQIFAQGLGRNVAFFIRSRNLEVLKRLMAMPGIDAVDGIVLPKVTPEELPMLAEVVSQLPQLCLMPTIETADAFDRRRLIKLRNALEQVINPVLCLRVGGNDLLRLLGLKRPKWLTLYDTPLRAVINDIIVTFRPAGYEISAPAFEHLDSPETLIREVELDVAHGLLSKTAIHPLQIPIIEQAYRVSLEEREMAERILAPDALAVFRYAGQMCEPATHRPWAKRLLLRAELFGMMS
jgi:citrate lyase beta subunit